MANDWLTEIDPNITTENILNNKIISFDAKGEKQRILQNNIFEENAVFANEITTETEQSCLSEVWYGIG